MHHTPSKLYFQILPKTHDLASLLQQWYTISNGGIDRTAVQQPTTFSAHPLTYAALHFTF
jgi:hypothetical protein